LRGASFAPSGFARQLRDGWFACGAIGGDARRPFIRQHRDVWRRDDGPPGLLSPGETPPASNPQAALLTIIEWSRSMANDTVPISGELREFAYNWNNACHRLRLAYGELSEAAREVDKALDELKELQRSCAADGLVDQDGGEELDAIAALNFNVDADIIDGERLQELVDEIEEVELPDEDGGPRRHRRRRRA
jgi:hypothetical protein